jgi:hypothetical protein
MAHDVFISYSSRDKPTADAVCAALEQHGIRCWIAPRDVLPGIEWGEAIVNAIHDSQIMVIVFSSKANESRHIMREVERAVSSGIAVVPFRIEDIKPSSSLELFIGSVHWLDALNPPLEAHLIVLANKISALLKMKNPSNTEKQEPPTDSILLPDINESTQKDVEVSHYCTQCGTPNLSRAKYCTHCGASLLIAWKICGQCNSRNTDITKYCINCGAIL